MIKNWFNSSENEQIHPSEEELLRCVDGELSAKESARVRSHLETCWNCRLQLEKLEGAISAFVEFRQQIQIPLTQKPPKNWNDFNNKLKQVALETPSTKRSRFGSFGSFGKYFRSFTKFTEWTPVWKRTAISAVASVLVVAIFWQFIFVKTVTANELLDKASQFQSEKIKTVAQPVVYQNLRVRHQDGSEMNWELWRDTTRSRFRQNVSNEINQNSDNQLWQILQANGFNPQEPLSAVNFAKWRKTLTQKTDTVENEQREDGKNLLTLKTVDLQAESAGKVIAGILKVRKEDFHPVEQILQISTGNGVETYSFREIEFQVLSLSALKPDFFPEPVESQTAIVQAKTLPSPTTEINANVVPSVEPSLAAANTANNSSVKQPDVPKISASTELEVEVLDLLNQAKADLGEQITVKREANGLLYVRGIVESQNRKNEILLALKPFQNIPAVRIDVKTIDEAVAEQKIKPVPSATAEKVESQSSKTASDTELLTYFKSEQAARAFGGQMISRSQRAMSRVYALKRLIAQFTTEELRQLSPEAKAKLLNLISSHARAFREETAGLRQELQPVFDGPNVGASNTADVSNITDVIKAVGLLLEYASANDRVVRSAFTVSAGNAQFTAIRTTQFWQSLRNAEALAAKLQSIK